MIRCILVFLLFPCLLQAQSAFIAGNDTICDNDQDLATVSVSFTGDSPFSFIFTINGVPQPSVITTINPYIINTKESGDYTLVSYNDANGFGSISGSGLVTVLENPTAIIHLQSDTLLITYPIAHFISQSIGNIVSWDWNFGTLDGIFSF